jgi:hypothetical protein
MVLPCAHAYEADVHYGLTRWLALKAGFDEPQADAIAVGNQRADSGLMDTLEVILEYACVGRFEEAARDVQRRHYPSDRAVPAAPQERAVTPGSAASRKPLERLLANAAGKEGLLLSKFGEALHTLQDSWSHAGVPGVPSPGGGLECAGPLASGHPEDRGGPNSHAADLTHRHPADVVQMAKVTYDALVAYPSVQGRKRDARPWADLTDAVGAFAKARTKTDKHDWFVAQGLQDTAFLELTTLPDGPRPGPLEFVGRKLPPLKGPTSTQHDAPADVKAFFDTLIARWLGAEPVEDVVAELAGAGPHDGKRPPKPDARLRELTARMKLWKVKDHGSVAELAHAMKPLSAAQLRTVDQLTKSGKAYVGPVSPQEAFFPLLAKGEYASPLLPYIVRELPAAGGNARTIAIARLMHAPYDTVGWIAQRRGDAWVLTDMVFAVDQ